jgi:hypothetical protein
VYRSRFCDKDTEFLSTVSCCANQGVADDARESMSHDGGSIAYEAAYEAIF